ncbi:hypothetical protein [Longimicrobium sp.]|uniref:hypothetical protein n=1 Tax=Longimicrobium sp. TaxID=2029185 RepID=UPI002E3411A7|nr:hypothetical protein [Longimicrobium sp.]HEX6042570.1 hypothetical protein [Longimicrobium sp.]
MRVLSAFTLLLTATLAACGGDSTGPGAGPGTAQPRGLSTSEANALGRLLLAPGVGVAQSGVNGATPTAVRESVGSGAALETGEIPFGFTLQCQPSGSVNVNGTLGAAWDVLTQLVAVHARVTLRHQACPVQTDNGLLTVTGDPAVDLTLTAAGNATGVQALLITQSGAVTWTRADGTSGRCAAQVAGAAIAGTPNYHVYGTVCGVTIDFTGPV